MGMMSQFSGQLHAAMAAGGRSAVQANPGAYPMISHIMGFGRAAQSPGGGG